MAGLTTAFPSSAKRELFLSGHCISAGVTATGVSGVSGAFTLTGMSTVTDIAVGMAASGSNVAAGAIVASVDSATQVTVSKAHTGTITSQSITFAGDTFKMVLVKHTPTGTYGAATVNYTDVTGNSDEATGTGYTAGGQAMTMVSPTLSTTTALISASNVSWTTVTVDVDGCVIQNTNARLGGTSGTNTTGAGRVPYVGDFGGRQTVTAGTLTVVMPVADSTHALLRIA